LNEDREEKLIVGGKQFALIQPLSLPPCGRSHLDSKDTVAVCCSSASATLVLCYRRGGELIALICSLSTDGRGFKPALTQWLCSIKLTF